jgi:hypothetical protein
MKKIFILLLLCSLRQMALAQGTITLSYGDMGLNINFSPLPGSPGTNQPAGDATYSRYKPYYNPFQPPTNDVNLLTVSINAGTNQPTDGWVYQMADDGSLQPVMELTNLSLTFSPILPIWPTNGDPFTNIIIESWPPTVQPLTSFPILPILPFTNNFPTPPNVYVYSQSMQLSEDQVQSLAQGKWYAEVDYGDDKYLGNLKPSFMASPTAVITVSPTTVFPSGVVPTPFSNNNTIGEVVIAPGLNKAATVALDGSESTDPFYLPLQFSWSDGTHSLAGETNVTGTWLPGTYQISLKASDGYSSGSQILMLKVISPEQAVNNLNLMVQQSYLDQRTMRALSLVLLKTQNHFVRGNTSAGVELLTHFQRQVNLQKMQTDNETVDWLIESSQEIIQAVKP